MAESSVDAGGIGAPVRRKEDIRLTTGRGEYTSDFFPDGLCHAALARSPHAHAVIREIDVAEALAVPGVIAVLTGADAADGVPAVATRPAPRARQSRATAHLDLIHLRQTPIKCPPFCYEHL